MWIFSPLIFYLPFLSFDKTALLVFDYLKPLCQNLGPGFGRLQELWLPEFLQLQFSLKAQIISDDKKNGQILSPLNLHILALQFCSTLFLRMLYLKDAVVTVLAKYLSPWSKLLCCRVLQKYVYTQSFQMGVEQGLAITSALFYFWREDKEMFCFRFLAILEPCVQLRAGAGCQSASAAMLLLPMVVFGQRAGRVSGFTLFCR